jgi:predicted nucleic acid-binding Zn ribbon protein
VNDIVREFQIESKLDEARIISLWKEITGSYPAKTTTHIRLQGYVLFVRLNSSVVRNELYMKRTEIIRQLNEKAGKEIVKEIVLQ